MLEFMNPQQFDQVFSIMEHSFPIDEYRTYAEQKCLLDNPKYKLYTLPDTQNSQISAFVSIWLFSDFAYIEHFAVSAAARCQGLGSSILNEIKHILSCQICLEVELPKTDLAKRRIAFYKRNGFALNDYPYIQPALSKGRHPLPLLLMTTDGTITPDRFAYIKTTLYQHVYNISPSDINTYLC